LNNLVLLFLTFLSRLWFVLPWVILSVFTFGLILSKVNGK